MDIPNVVCDLMIILLLFIIMVWLVVALRNGIVDLLYPRIKNRRHKNAKRKN